MSTIPPPLPPRPPRLAPEESIRLGINIFFSTGYYRLYLISVLQSGLSFCFKVQKYGNCICRKKFELPKKGVFTCSWHSLYFCIYLFIYYFFKLQKHNYLYCTYSTTVRHNTYSTYTIIKYITILFTVQILHYTDTPTL